MVWTLGSRMMEEGRRSWFDVFSCEPKVLYADKGIMALLWSFLRVWSISCYVHVGICSDRYKVWVNQGYMVSDRKMVTWFVPFYMVILNFLLVMTNECLFPILPMHQFLSHNFFHLFFNKGYIYYSLTSKGTFRKSECISHKYIDFN